MYGEFKTLAAQESDWMERLEKKLRKSTDTAADAEEISEELDDIENFLNNHPEERIRKLEDLAAELRERRILIGSLEKEAERLKDRWKEVEVKAKRRTKTLEGKWLPSLYFLCTCTPHVIFDANESTISPSCPSRRVHSGGSEMGVPADRGARLANRQGHPFNLSPRAGADRG